MDYDYVVVFNETDIFFEGTTELLNKFEFPFIEARAQFFKTEEDMNKFIELYRSMV